MEVQNFETEGLPLLKPKIHSSRFSYRPLVSILAEPVDVLHCERAGLASAFKELSGRWTYIMAKPGIPSASRAYSVRLGPLTVKDATLHLFRDGEKVSEVRTDENGRASFNLPSKEPSSYTYSVSLLPELAPFKTPLQDSFPLSVWLVTCRVTNRTDRWWRFAGRSFTGELARSFWKDPLTTIGLGSPYGTQTFIDIVPVFGDRDVTLEYGISAFCSTPEPYPDRTKCLAYRTRTWWRFEVEGFNVKTRETVQGDLNIDRHLKVTFTSEDIRGEVIKPPGAET